MLKQHGELTVLAIEAGGGKATVGTADAIELHGAGLKLRIVVTEFSTFENALATYNGSAYQAAFKVRGSAAEWGFRIVEGVE